jgi:hypothetical protein
MHYLMPADENSQDWHCCVQLAVLGTANRHSPLYSLSTIAFRH